MTGYRVWDTWEDKFVSDILIMPYGRLVRMEYGRIIKDVPDERYTIEFCTGVKDKKGNEICIGDIILYGARLYKVVWRDMDSSIILESDDGEIIKFLEQDKSEQYTYIGNRHKNKEIWDNI